MDLLAKPLCFQTPFLHGRTEQAPYVRASSEELRDELILMDPLPVHGAAVMRSSGGFLLRSKSMCHLSQLHLSCDSTGSTGAHRVFSCHFQMKIEPSEEARPKSPESSHKK